METLLAPSDFMTFTFQDNTIYRALELGFNVSKVNVERFLIKPEYLSFIKNEQDKNRYRLLSYNVNKSAFCHEYFSIPVINKEFSTRSQLREYLDNEGKTLKGHKVLWKVDIAIFYNGNLYEINREVSGIIDFPPSEATDSVWAYILFKDEFLEDKRYYELSIQEQEEINPTNQAFYLFKQHIGKHFSKLKPLELS